MTSWRTRAAAMPNLLRREDVAMKDSSTTSNGLPPRQGLYDPWFEHEACGVGFVVNVKGNKSQQIIRQFLQVLRNLDHRGSRRFEANTDNSASILLHTAHDFFRKLGEEAGGTLPKAGHYGAG